MEMCGQVKGPAILSLREIVSRFVTHSVRGLKNYNNGNFEN